MSIMSGFRNYKKMEKIREKKSEERRKEIERCKRQFPDCPEEQNYYDCKSCPFFTK